MHTSLFTEWATLPKQSSLYSLLHYWLCASVAEELNQGGLVRPRLELRSTGFRI